MSASATPVEITVREGTADDRGFVIQAWIRGYQRSAEVKDLTGPEYSPMQRTFINRLLARSQVFIAVNPLDPGQFFGFAVAEHELDVAVVHWIYVKSLFRGFGIGRRLLTAATGGAKTVFYTARAPRRADEEKLRRGGARFNPYLR